MMYDVHFARHMKIIFNLGRSCSFSSIFVFPRYHKDDRETKWLEKKNVHRISLTIILHT